MRTVKNILLISTFLYIQCHGAIWKTEEAYIIDDLADDDTASTIPSANNSCVTSSGAQGQCMALNECYPMHELFTSAEFQLLEDLQRYVNGTDLESCTPPLSSSSQQEGMRYVCCTSLLYQKSKPIDYEEYLRIAPKSNETLPEIPFAIPDPFPTKIVTGSRASPGEFPFAVAIIHRGRQICGGSLLAANWVLSAAHCFDSFNPAAVRQLLIKVGDYDISTNTEAQHQDIKVLKLFLHPGFFRDKGFFRDDVALIKLRTAVSQTGNIRTIQLHSGSIDINSNTVQATVCGWGKTCNNCPQSTVLRKTTVSIVPNNVCSQRYRGTAAPPITQNMCCAGGQGGDACNGDSGGPMVIYSGQTYQIGIVSWGIGCGQYPGVYTRVSNFRAWIAKHMQRA